LNNNREIDCHLVAYNLCFFRFIWLGRHNAVELRIFRKFICKRQNHVAIKEEPFTLA